MGMPARNGSGLATLKEIDRASSRLHAASLPYAPECEESRHPPACYGTNLQLV
jgi:hypothetical protein